MRPSSIDARLPTGLRTIAILPDGGLRDQLTNLITDILSMVKQAEGFPPDPIITILVNRFFEYTTKTCESPVLTIRRAKWILTYGSVVKRQLQRFINRYVVYAIDDYTHIQYADMIAKIVTMSELVKLYIEKSDIADGTMLLIEMDAIVELAGSTKPSQHDSYYTVVDRYITKINARLSMSVNATTSGVVLTLSDTLLRDMGRLRHRMDQYRNRVIL